MLADLLKSIDLGAYYSFDEAIHHSQLLREFMQLGDWIGSYIGVAILALLALALLLRQGRIGAAVLAVATLLVAVGAVEALRIALPAHRPAVAATLVGEDEMQRSFPAREVFIFTVATVLLLWAAWRSMAGRLARTALTAVLAILVLWVAMSQLLLGLHFVTDVAAGLFGGLALGLLATRVAPSRDRQGAGLRRAAAP